MSLAFSRPLLRAAFGFALACFVCAAPARAEKQLIDAIAAQVGAEIVLLSEVVSAAAPVEARARQAGASREDIAGIRAQALEREIERALIRQVVRRAELDATESEVDDAISGIAEENKLSKTRLRESVEAQGMPYALYRERIRGEIEHSKVMNGIVASRVRVDDEAVRERYAEEFGKQPRGGEEFFLRHILRTAQSAPALERACQEVNAARARIAGGENFRVVAAQVSEASPETGGTLGYIHENELAPWMEKTVRAMQTGDLSGVIKTSFGCNLLQLVERRSFAPVSFEDARETLHGRLFNEQMQVEYTRFIEELRSETYIERKQDFAAADGGAS